MGFDREAALSCANWRDKLAFETTSTDDLRYPAARKESVVPAPTHAGSLSAQDPSPVVLRDDAISLSPAMSYWRIRRTGIGEPPPVMIGVPPPPPALAPQATTFMM